MTRIGDQAFGNCTGITRIVIPESVTSIGYQAFGYCNNLKTVVISDSVTSIGDSVFEGCSKLESIKVHSNNPNYKDIDGNLYTKDGKTLIQYAMKNTDTDFSIPDGVTSIGKYAFCDCEGLTSVVIPDGVTSIGFDAFRSCTSLTSIEIPDSVTSIGAWAFWGCRSLTSIKYRGTEEQWEAISKGANWDHNTDNYTITYNYTGE